MKPILKSAINLAAVFFITTFSGNAEITQPVIDDLSIKRDIAQKIESVLTTDTALTWDKLQEQMKRKASKINLPEPSTTPLENLYQKRLKSVVTVTF